MAPLDGAVPGAQMDHLAVGVGQDLDFDVARRHDALLRIDRVVVEGQQRFAPGVMKLLLQVCGVLDLPDAPAAPAFDGLQQDGIAHGLGKGQGLRHARRSRRQHLRARDRDDPLLPHHLLGHHLVPQTPHHLRRGTDEDQAVVPAGGGEFGGFGEESVAGMNGVGTRFFRGPDDLLAVQVVRERARSDGYRRIGAADEQRFAVG